MAVFNRVDMFFESGKRGWTETHYSATPVGSLQFLALGLVAPRTAFLSSSARITDVRVTVIGAPRDALFCALPLSGVPGSQPESPNDINVALQYRMKATEQHWRFLKYNAFPDSWVADGVLVNPAAIVFMNTYRQALIDNGFGLKTQVPHPAQPILQMSIVKTDPLGFNWTKCTTIAPHGFSDGDPVVIRNYTANPLMNGRWRVRVVDVTNFWLVGSQRYRNDTNLIGTVQGVVPLFAAYTNGFYERVGSRKVGRPSFVPRGRRSSLIRHH